MEDRLGDTDAEGGEAADVGEFAAGRRLPEGVGQAAVEVVVLLLDEIEGFADARRDHAAPAGAADIGFFDPVAGSVPPAVEIGGGRLQGRA